MVFVGDGKGADALRPFGKRLRPSGPGSRAVAMDMSEAYQAAVRTHLPKAKIVFDHFHVIKLFNEKLSDLRRALAGKAAEVQHKEVLKGTRWLLLRAPKRTTSIRWPLNYTRQVQKPESDEDFGQGTEPLMDVIATIVTHTQPAELQ